MTTNDQRPVVVITCNRDKPVDIALVSSFVGHLADIQTVDLMHKRMTEEEEERFLAEAGHATVIFMRPGWLSRNVTDRMPRLQGVTIFGAGLNQVDVKACTDRGIYVINAPGANAQAVAELTFGILLALARRIPRADRLVREGRWLDAGHTGTELQHKVLGIVGLGHIGARVARIALGFSMHAIGFDPHVPPERFCEMGVVPVGLRALMAEADVVSIHAPLTDSTRGMIGSEEIALMKPTALLVNTARGLVVDGAALYAALRDGRIAGAALDAFEIEPLPGDNPILALDNVVVTPHLAGITYEARRPTTEMVCRDIARVLSGEHPVNVGNPEVIRVRKKMGLPA